MAHESLRWKKKESRIQMAYWKYCDNCRSEVCDYCHDNNRVCPHWNLSAWNIRPHVKLDVAHLCFCNSQRWKTCDCAVSWSLITQCWKTRNSQWWQQRWFAALKNLWLRIGNSAIMVVQNMRCYNQSSVAKHAVLPEITSGMLCFKTRSIAKRTSESAAYSAV